MECDANDISAFMYWRSVKEAIKLLASGRRRPIFLPASRRTEGLFTGRNCSEELARAILAARGEVAVGLRRPREAPGEAAADPAPNLPISGQSAQLLTLPARNRHRPTGDQESHFEADVVVFVPKTDPGAGETLRRGKP
jgi:hypothetical protein